jgi:DNA-binding SARP family transcriptional activator/outer membrane protein assembly factor BamB
LDFRLLGPLEVFDGARAVAIGGGKRRSLLALLLLHGNKVVPADRLIDELWGEHPPPTAAKGLQVYISQLRRELAPKDPASNGHILVTRSNGYVLQVGPDEFDVQRFERSLDDGERALQAGEPERAAQRLRDGLALWRGPPLADFAYEQFAQHEIARLEELHLVAIEQRIDADLALGRHAQVVGELDALVSRYPMRERVRAQSMLALYRCGRQAEALESYRDARRTMTEQLGLEPGPALRDLEARILAQSPELAAPTTPRRSSRRETPAPTTPVALRTRRRAAALVIAGAAVILGVAALIAALRDEDNSTPRAVALDLAKDSLVALDPAGRGPEVAIPLPGRPTAVAAAGGRVFVATVDSATLTEVDGRTGKIVRIVAALQITPAAVAAAGNRVWVADRRRGLVVAFDVGYERQAARIPYPRARATGPAGLNVREPVAMATGGGAVWVTDGSPRLTRIDARSGAVSQATAGRTLDGVAGGAGAVWAFSARSATVVRVDPHTGAFTDRIRIATRRGTDKPYPIGIAATPGTVWVLNGNTATVTRIDAAQGGVRDTVPIGMDRLPRGIGTSGRTVWVANFDGSVSRIAPGRSTPSSVWVGDSLGAVVAAGGRVWVTTTALDQQLPGGKG